jgi:hypothetical protein
VVNERNHEGSLQVQNQPAIDKRHNDLRRGNHDVDRLRTIHEVLKMGVPASSSHSLLFSNDTLNDNDRNESL